MGRPAHPARLAAIAEGRTVYFTGNRCNLGFVAGRSVTDSKCGCGAHQAVMKARAAKNYAANRAERIMKQSSRNEASREAVAEYRREHYRRNKVEYVERATRWAGNNQAERRAIAKKWAADNPEAVRANGHKRRARKLNATPGWYGELDELVMREALHLTALREACTGFKWEVDHIIPLAGKLVCGLHVAANIQVIPMTENRRKSNQYAVQ